MDGLLPSFLKAETWKAALAELVGTLFLTLAAILAGTPYAVALTLTALVYAIGKTSGCHVNPAITIGLVAARRLPVAMGLLYVLAQVAGALLAGQLSFLVGDPAPDYQAAGRFAEFFGFGFLILTVVAVSDKYVPAAGSGVAIGAALAAGLVTSGGILNPAIAIAVSETRTAATWATVLSGIAFALLFSLFAPKEEAKEDAQEGDTGTDEEQETPEVARRRLVLRASGAGTPGDD
ncbi:MAG: aquaporin [Chloroflexota bacterium]|nr:aquaporin [Chloroflexota bacterium]